MDSAVNSSNQTADGEILPSQATSHHSHATSHSSHATPHSSLATSSESRAISHSTHATSSDSTTLQNSSLNTGGETTPSLYQFPPYEEEQINSTFKDEVNYFYFIWYFLTLKLGIICTHIMFIYKKSLIT